jgi:hypothetical protein
MHLKVVKTVNFCVMYILPHFKEELEGRREEEEE